jgi:hypothetical protein
MSKVNFKAYLTPEKERLPSDLEVIVATYGPFLTIAETAKCLKRERKAVEAWIHAGKLEAKREGERGSYIISATSIIRFYRELTSAAA